MHVHGNLFDPNLQLDATSAAARAEAKAEAERTRKKLLGAAAALAGEAEGSDCVVRLSEDAQQDQQADPRARDQGAPSRQEQSGDAEAPAKSFSDWA